MTTASTELVASPEMAGGVAESELSSQKLISLRVMSPHLLDRTCKEESRRQFLIEGFLPCKSIAILAGDSTIGKSPLVHQLALSVASGLPFLGMPTTKTRVLHFDLENSLHDCKVIRDAQVKFLNLPETPDGLLLRVEPCPSDGVLEHLLAEVKPGLVVIDSIRSFRPDVTRDNPSAGAWLKEIRRFAREYGCSFILVHHLRKSHVGLDGSATRWGLETIPVSEWLEDMEGPRAFVNQTDVRIAADRGRGEVALELKWTRRLHGDSPLVLLDRVFDDDGEPVGYNQTTGVALLTPERKEALKKLSPEFSFKEAR